MIPRLVLKLRGRVLGCPKLSGESSLDTHRSSFGSIDGLFYWRKDYVVKEDHLVGCEIFQRIEEASARANMLIAGSIVRIHLLRNSFMDFFSLRSCRGLVGLSKLHYLQM